MSQDVRTPRYASDFPPPPGPGPREDLASEATGTPGIAPPETITVDDYANRLMDDLFGDLERALEGSLQLPNTPLSREEVVSLKRLSLAELSLPPVTLPNPNGSLASPSAPGYSSLPSPQAVKRRPRRRGQWLPRLLLGLGVITLVAAIGIWSRYPETWQRLRSALSVAKLWLPPISPATPTPAASPAPVANSDAEFSRYLQRALAMIEQQPANGTAIPVPPLPNGMSLLQPLVPPTIGNAPPTEVPPAVTDRVYVPIYPTAQLPTATAPTGVPLPAQIPAVPAVPQAVPLPAHPPPLPGPAIAPAASTPPPTSSATKYTLVGVLELGDRSTALFESNGVARRINMGESIGTSGWSLVEVNNQEAIIRRNGEVRSIYVGQSF